MLLLRCPKCANKMKYAPKGAYSGKSKRCVYCGKIFMVEENISEHLPEKLRKERAEESEDCYGRK